VGAGAHHPLQGRHARLPAPDARLGETEQTAKRFLAENQRFTEHTFSASLPPLTSRFFLIQAELKDAHGVDVKLKIDGAPPMRASS